VGDAAVKIDVTKIERIMGLIARFSQVLGAGQWGLLDKYNI
jgi:hypothetical protein